MKKILVAVVMNFVAASAMLADPLTCNLAQYKPGGGITAAVERDLLTVSWTGDAGASLRLRFAIDRAQPVIRDLAIRRSGGQWLTLGKDLVPEFRVTSGVRRMSTQQVMPLKELGIKITPEVIEREKWQVFWDAPLLVPGTPTALARNEPLPEIEGLRANDSLDWSKTPRNLDLPRKPEEIRRADASFNTTSCTVKTDGNRLEVTFPGLAMGIFAGSLRYTVYSGTNLVRMEAVAKTEEPSVAYKYEAGLKGFSTSLTPRVTWRDTGGDPQEYRFGGVKNETAAGVKARNRILIAEGRGGSVATFPPPHTFFFAREVETNLGYVWYRKDSDNSFSLGVRQPDREEEDQYVQNFALYNAPPGTWQRMAVYYYVSDKTAEPARQSVLAFTHSDRFKPVSGYKTMVNHMHIRFTEQLRKSGSLDGETQDVRALRGLGINIVGLSDFHSDLHQFDPGPRRFEDERDYAIACAKASDKDFLVLPWEETYLFGGHYNTLFPHNVYWTMVRQPGQPFTEDLPGYGKVYHADNPVDFQRLLDTENGYWFYAHQRTKGSTGYPDASFDKPFVKNDRNLGVSYKPGMGMDLSESRLCEWRCFDAMDTMNNLYANSGLGPKYLITDIDTYRKNPEDDLFPQFPVTYVKLDRLPGPAEDWSPILKALRNGTFFVTTGEILIKDYAVKGTGAQRTIAADVEWTFPLEFVEVVWGDGKKIDRKIIPATNLQPFGKKQFVIPFDATGKSWVRFAAWDSAGNGAFVQPIWLSTQTTTGRRN